MSAYLNALAEEGTREDLLAQIARLTEERERTAAAHSARVTELLEANNSEVERRRAAERGALEAGSYQTRVQAWMHACFGPAISADRMERGDRLIEEVLELLQAVDYPPERVVALLAYVWDRPKGDPPQEVGGVMVTLAAFCTAHDLDMHTAGEAELARIWTKVEQIRAKQAAKPTGSALPMAWSHPAPTPAQETAAVPAGWKMSVSESDGRTWLNLRTPYGASVDLSVRTRHGDGQAKTIGAQVLEYFRDAIAVPVSPPAESGEAEAAIQEIERLVYGGQHNGGTSLARAVKVIRTALASTPAPQPGGAVKVKALAERAGSLLRGLEQWPEDQHPRFSKGDWREIKAVIAEAAALSPSPSGWDAGAWKPTHRHVKRGSTYRVIGKAQVQAPADDPLTDYELTYVYQGEDGQMWVRRCSEFDDGRYIPLQTEEA